MSCGVGCRSGSDPVLLWLWHRPAATAPIRPLAWEPPYAMGVAQEMTKRQKNKKIKKIKDHNSYPEGTSDETDLCSLIDTNFTKWVMKILKELRKAVNRNADYFKWELETMRSQEKLQNSFVKTKGELKALNNKRNNA